MNKKQILKYYNDNRLLCNCICIAILFFVNCFVQDFSILTFIIVAMMILLSDMSTGFSMLVFTIPYCCLDGYISVLMFFGTFLVFLIKGYYIYVKVDKKKTHWMISAGVLAFLIYSLLPIGEYNSGLFIKLGIIILLVLFFNLFMNYRKEMSIKNNLAVLALSLMISAVFYLTYFVSPYIRAKEIWYYGDSFIRFTCLLINPNTLAMICEICLSLLTYFVISGKSTWIDIISFIIYTVLGLSTISKTFLILLSLMFIILLIYVLRKFKKQIFWIVIGICGVILFLVLFKNDFIYTYLGRFLTENPEDKTASEIINGVTTGRFELWMGVISYMIMNPLVLIFGRGLGEPLIQSLSAHNFYVSLVYELGLVGALLFLWMFVSIFIVFYKKHKVRTGWAILIPLVVIGMLMMVEDLFLYIY